ncbi:hypothetical protein GH714_036179 [Hevea brasiliensis]|uniref:Uncharacterized protein n=1 Tax=Hevea brasiliensis TaxID=3981 RepID=A0A6A6KET1_HEVBR|nr:hypothetical protein GH714_036179 [Hevea brasiliensis]
MAQRLIQPKEVKKMEDTGSDAFDSLLSGSFFHFSHVDPLDDQPSMVDLRGSLCISKLENVTPTVKAKKADLKSKHELHKLAL